MQRPVTFGVLGTVVIETSAGAIIVDEPKRRAVLAALLLDLGRVVPIHRLATLVWGETQPPSVRKAIQVYISHLRRSLASLPDAEIASEHDGYRLASQSDTVDLHLFRQLVTKARRQCSTEQRRVLLNSALALWRGRPFAGTNSHVLQERIAPALEEEKLSAMEDLYQVELQLGRHAEVLGPLIALVAEHPLRERFAASLMAALHRCGRNAEAAQVFYNLRAYIVRETGMEPSAALSALHMEVLANKTPMPSPIPVKAAGREDHFAEKPAALVNLADRFASEGDRDRALAYYYAGRALARDRGEDATWVRASQGIIDTYATSIR